MSDVTDATHATLDNDATIVFNGNMDATPIRTCQCGCGAEVARRYLPGHDARHKAAIVARANDSTTRQLCDRAIDELLDRGWARYATLETLRAYQPRRGNRPTILRAEVTTWLVDPDGIHHARHACRAMTKSARAAGLINPLTRVAMQAAITRTTTAPTGWDGCQECTHEVTLDEATESWDMGRIMALAAYEAEGLTRNGNAKSGKAKPKDPTATPNLKILKTWVVEPDDEPVVVVPKPSRHPQRAAMVG